jgi:hypothetical protein
MLPREIAVDLLILAPHHEPAIAEAELESTLLAVEPAHTQAQGKTSGQAVVEREFPFVIRQASFVSSRARFH